MPAAKSVRVLLVGQARDGLLSVAVVSAALPTKGLTVVRAVVVTGTFSALGLFMIGFKAIVFIAGSIGVGLWITPHFVKRAARWKVRNFELPFSAHAFFLSGCLVETREFSGTGSASLNPITREVVRRAVHISYPAATACPGEVWLLRPVSSSPITCADTVCIQDIAQGQDAF